MRLSRPKMVHAFVHWQRDWQAAESLKELKQSELNAMSQEERLASEAARRAELEDKVLTLQLELTAAREAMAANRGQDVDMKRNLEEQLNHEREQRINHLMQVGLRRLFQQDLAKGWSRQIRLLHPSQYIQVLQVVEGEGRQWERKKALRAEKKHFAT